MQTGRGSSNEYLGSPPFYAINRGKRSVVLDLKVEDDREALERLIATADVFLSNYRSVGGVRACLDLHAGNGALPCLSHAVLDRVASGCPRNLWQLHALSCKWRRECGATC